MDCLNTKKFVAGVKKQCRDRQRSYSELAGKIHQRATTKAKRDMLFGLYERCGIAFDDAVFKDTSMERLMRIVDALEHHDPAMATNALHIFGEHALQDPAHIESFLELVEGAWGKPGMDKLLPSLNGRINVQGIDYTLQSVSDLGSGFAALEGFELSTVENADRFRGCDVVFNQRIKTSGGIGEMLVAELKSGEKMELKVEQGIKAFEELEARKLAQEPFLFRFIHNTDEIANPDHVAGQARNFLEKIHATARSSPAGGSVASSAVLTKLEDSGLLKGWRAENANLNHWIASGSTAAEKALRENQVADAVAKMKDWFYLNHRIIYPKAP